MRDKRDRKVDCRQPYATNCEELPSYKAAMSDLILRVDHQNHPKGKSGNSPINHEAAVTASPFATFETVLDFGFTWDWAIFPNPSVILR